MRKAVFVRRILAFVLSVLFVTQPAAAASVPVSLSVQPLMSAIQSTWLFAVLTGNAGFYAATHAPRPALPTPLPRTTSAPNMRRSLLAQQIMVQRMGAPRVHALTIQADDASAPERDPLAMRSRTAMLQPQSRRPQLRAMIATPSAATGINPWWTYEEGAVSGVGRWMVNVANGNALLQADDLSVSERGIGFSFRRTFNSQSLHDANNSDGTGINIYGNGWTNPFDARLVYNATSGTMTVIDIDGASYTYTADGNGNWVAPAGQHAQLVAKGGGCAYQWWKKNGTRYHFWSPAPAVAATCGLAAGEQGLLWGWTARNHNNTIFLTFTWANQDASTLENLQKIVATHSDGQTMTLNFVPVNGHNELANIERPDGLFISYLHDNSGNLTEVDRPAALARQSAMYGTPQGQSYKTPELPENYSQTGSSVTACSPRAVLAQRNGIVDGTGAPRDGACTQIVWDAQQRAIDVSQIGIVDFAPNDMPNNGTSGVLQGVNTSWHAFDNHVFTYGQTDSYGNAATNETDNDGHAAQWGYDAIGRVVDTSSWLTATGTPLVTRATWDQYNNVIETVDARRQTTDYGYDANGNTLWVQEPQVVTSLGAGRPIARYAYDQFNNVIAYCDPYYEWTHAAASCSAVLGATYYAYDTSDSMEPYGKLTDTYTPMGYHHHITYDTNDWGLPVQVQGDAIANDNGRTPTQSFSYDLLGNLLTYNNGVGTWTLSYDAMNRPLTRIDPDDHESFTYYNVDGTVSESETPLQHAHSPSWGSTFAYDADGNQTTANVWRMASSSAAATLETTTKWYDGADRLVEVQQPQDNAADIYTNPWMTRYLYDLSQNGSVWYSSSSTSYSAHGNLFKTQEYLPSVAQSGPVTATVAQAKQIANNMWVDLKGTAFDALDRPTAKYSMVDAYGATSDSLATETMTYDGTSMTGSDDTGLLNKYCNAMIPQQCSSNAYDVLGRLVDVQFTDANTPERKVTSFDPDGRTLQTWSAAHGYQNFTFDNDGREVTNQEASGGGVTSPATFTHEYYADGMLKQLDVTSSGLNQTGLFQYSYQADGRVQTQTIEDDAQANVGATSVHLQYSAAGRISKRTETGPGGNPNPETWSYDANGMLSQMQAPASSQCSQQASNCAISGLTYGPDGALLQGQYNGFSYSNRGELLHNGTTTAPVPFYANGTSVSFAQATQGSTPSYKMVWDGRTGAMLSTDSDIPDPSGQNPDSISDSSFTYDQAGRMLNETQTVSPGFSPGSLARTYDDENHTITSAASQTTTDGKTFFEQSIAAYDWGANGHPVRIGSATGASNGPAPTSVPQSQYETLHWDGDQLIFTSNANGQVDDIKIGAGGDITPLDPSFTGITFWDRGPTGAIQYIHNVNGTGGTPNLAATPSSNYSLAAQIGPSSFLWTDGSQKANWGKLLVPTRVVGIGQGKLLGMFRTDGITDGFNTIQGVRTEDSTAGTWTTPDAYAGNVHDPASQKSYMWNGNNAVAYSDPTGYSISGNDTSGAEEYTSFSTSNGPQEHCDDCAGGGKDTSNGVDEIAAATPDVVRDIVENAVYKEMGGYTDHPSNPIAPQSFLRAVSADVNAQFKARGIDQAVKIVNETAPSGAPPRVALRSTDGSIYVRVSDGHSGTKFANSVVVRTQIRSGGNWFRFSSGRFFVRYSAVMRTMGSEGEGLPYLPAALRSNDEGGDGPG